MRLYTVCSRLFAHYRQLTKQERYFRQEAPAILAQVIPGPHQLLPPAATKRIIKYYQLVLNVLGDNFYQLTGHQLTNEEHQRIVLLSIFMPFFDDLYDDQLLTHENVLALVSAPELYEPIGKEDQLIKALYLELLRVIPHRELFIQHLQAGAHWEKESLKQLSDQVTEEELYQITYNKSYYSILLVCTVLDHYPSADIQQMLYPIAGLLQLTNDAFDVWKDIQNGIYTLPNRYLSFDQLLQLFLTETARINQQLWQMPYPAKNKQAYAITIHSLPAMGWMALEQLKVVTAGITNYEALRNLSRKELVTDLDSLPQQIKWIRQVQRFHNYHQATSNGHVPQVVSLPPVAARASS